MEAILFSGIQAAGKSSFFKAHFADTHVRINLDMLRTRHREQLLLAACLQARQPFVVDNTNLSAEDRARYIGPARAAGFRVVAYRFFVPLEAAIARNVARQVRRPVPEKALRAAARRWQVPQWDEGFDALYDVCADGGDARVVAVERR